jgi:hypothetical protein
LEDAPAPGPNFATLFVDRPAGVPKRSPDHRSLPLGSLTKIDRRSHIVVVEKPSKTAAGVTLVVAGHFALAETVAVWSGGDHEVPSPTTASLVAVSSSVSDKGGPIYTVSTITDEEIPLVTFDLTRPFTAQPK